VWPVERIGTLQTLICAPVVRPKWCPTSSNPALLPSWTMVVCPSFTLLMMLLLPGWPTMGLNCIRKKKKNWPARGDPETHSDNDSSHYHLLIPLERSYAVRSGALQREQKYYLITNSNFWQNTGEHKHTLYSLQPTIAHNEYLFNNSGNIQAIKLSQRICKHNVRYDVI